MLAVTLYAGASMRFLQFFAVLALSFLFAFFREYSFSLWYLPLANFLNFVNATFLDCKFLIFVIEVLQTFLFFISVFFNYFSSFLYRLARIFRF